MQESLQSEKYKRRKNKSRREVSKDEKGLLDRTPSEWLWLAFWNTPQYRLDRERVAYLETLTDFNLQYDKVRSVYLAEKKEVCALQEKYNKIKERTRKRRNEGSGLDEDIVTSLHRLMVLGQHIQNRLDSVRFYDTVMIDIINQEMQLDQALSALSLTSTLCDVNATAKYSRGHDFTYGTSMIRTEMKEYIKNLKKRQPTDKLLANAEATKSMMANESKVKNTSTALLLKLLDEETPGSPIINQSSSSSSSGVPNPI